MADIQLAFNLQTQGKLDEAAEIYKEFLLENPNQPDVSNLLGQIYFQKGEYTKAKKLFETATEGFPCAEFYQNLAFVYLKEKLPQKAMECFDKVIEFEPENINAVRNIAQMAKKTEQHDSAIKYFNIALNLDKNDEVGWNQLGLIYEKKHEYLKAKECYIKSLKIKENYHAAHNLGVLHRTLRNFDESIRCLHQALKLNPTNQETMISLGMSYLSKKDLKNGQKYYAYLMPEVKEKYRNHWDGKKHPDSTLFVFYYAGYGDHIMYSRYLPYLKEYFKKVKVFLPPDIKILIEKNFDGIEFVDCHTEDYDYSANMMELHFLLNMDFEHIPSASGYLTVNDAKVENFKNRFFKTEKKKIGLFWQGNPNVFANRSIRLKELSPLFNKENIEFYSFEIGDVFNQIEEFPNLIDIGKEIKHYEDTAAALMNLDLLISIDTSILHLAGALGVKTFLFLPYSSEWRWFKDTKTTPWYDSVTIFKQEEQWNWENVVLSVSQAIDDTFIN